MKSTSRMFKALFGGVILLLGFALVGHVEAADTWSLTGSMSAALRWHMATLMLDGRVLVSGGSSDGLNGLASAEIYDPALGTWSLTGSMNTGREGHTATRLPDGRVLVTGGNNSVALASAEIYDPALGTWSLTDSMSTSRISHTATLLSGGRVLVSGGNSDGSNSGSSMLASAEIFSPYDQPQNKDDCKKNGWQGLTRADGTPFKNQGDCSQYVNPGK